MSQMAVTDKAISAIKNMIIDGELKPGDRLPPEKQLSERIRVSRNSLREAVKALSVIQVLSVRQGDDTRDRAPAQGRRGTAPLPHVCLPLPDIRWCGCPARR